MQFIAFCILYNKNEILLQPKAEVSSDAMRELCSFVTKSTKSSGVPIPRTLKRPRRGVEIIGRSVICTKPVFVDKYFCFYSVVFSGKLFAAGVD